MSGDAEEVNSAVEQVTQEVKAVKIENGAATEATNGTPNKSDDNGIPFKVSKLCANIQLFSPTITRIIIINWNRQSIFTDS